MALHDSSGIGVEGKHQHRDLSRFDGAATYHIHAYADSRLSADACQNEEDTHKAAPDHSAGALFRATDLLPRVFDAELLQESAAVISDLFGDPKLVLGLTSGHSHLGCERLPLGAAEVEMAGLEPPRLWDAALNQLDQATTLAGTAEDNRKASPGVRLLKHVRVAVSNFEDGNNLARLLLPRVVRHLCNLLRCSYKELVVVLCNHEFFAGVSTDIESMKQLLELSDKKIGAPVSPAAITLDNDHLDRWLSCLTATDYLRSSLEKVVGNNASMLSSLGLNLELVFSARARWSPYHGLGWSRARAAL